MKSEEHIVGILETLSPTSYVEIGVLRGECLCYVAKHSKNAIKCYGIDPYCGYVDVAHGNYTVGYAASRLSLHRCQENIANANVQDKVELILQDSHIAKDDFADESVGVVYIDKNFTYEGVVQDILDWWPKVKKGGYLTGHEWVCPVVKKAVIDTMTKLGLEDTIVGKDELWIVYKPNEE